MEETVGLSSACEIWKRYRKASKGSKICLVITRYSEVASVFCRDCARALLARLHAWGVVSGCRCLDAVMVSQHFWPHLLGEDMKLHPSMQKKLAEFSKAYSVIKNPRLLVWKKQVKCGRST